jgi:hypothetical protein
VLLSVEILFFCGDFHGASGRELALLLVVAKRRVQAPEGAPELKPGVERGGTPGMVSEQKKPLTRGDANIAVERFRHPLAGFGLVFWGWVPGVSLRFTPGCTPSRLRHCADRSTKGTAFSRQKSKGNAMDPTTFHRWLRLRRAVFIRGLINFL